MRRVLSFQTSSPSAALVEAASHPVTEDPPFFGPSARVECVVARDDLRVDAAPDLRRRIVRVAGPVLGPEANDGGDTGQGLSSRLPSWWQQGADQGCDPVLQSGIGTQELPMGLSQLPGAALDVRRECRSDGVEAGTSSAVGLRVPQLF